MPLCVPVPVPDLCDFWGIFRDIGSIGIGMVFRARARLLLRDQFQKERLAALEKGIEVATTHHHQHISQKAHAIKSMFYHEVTFAKEGGVMEFDELGDKIFLVGAQVISAAL